MIVFSFLIFVVFFCFVFGLRRHSQYIPALYVRIMNSAPAFFFHDWIFIFAVVVGLRIRSRRCCVSSLQALYMKVKKMGGEKKKAEINNANGMRGTGLCSSLLGCERRD